MSDTRTFGDRPARLLPILLALIAVVALFAMTGFSSHNPTAGNSMVPWISIDSLAINVPNDGCCAPLNEHQGAAPAVAAHQADDGHGALAALCAFVVFAAMLMLRRPRMVQSPLAVLGYSRRTPLRAVAVPVSTPPLSVLCVSRT